MAGIIANNVNILRVDFHSHTSGSHDGRGGWDVENNRDWHRAAGFDVAFITDHASVVEAERGLAVNPNPVVGGTTVLQSIEVTWTGEHVSIPGAQRTYRGLLTENMRDVDVQALTLASVIRGREPVVIWHHPHDLDRLPIAEGPGTAGIRAIEILNGSPADMDEIRAHRREIATMAQQRGIALTSGSDNHGWGRATPGWTLMHIPGWQTLDHETLAAEIETALRTSGFRSTIVVERRVADPTGSRLSLALTLFGAPLRMLTTISVDERAAWLIWTWALFGAVWWVRRSRGAESRSA
jgi:predicted metal-dependent phosphoesterase TrpH